MSAVVHIHPLFVLGIEVPVLGKHLPSWAPTTARSSYSWPGSVGFVGAVWAVAVTFAAVSLPTLVATSSFTVQVSSSMGVLLCKSRDQ
jgi:hypothetical protein